MVHTFDEAGNRVVHQTTSMEEVLTKRTSRTVPDQLSPLLAVFDPARLFHGFTPHSDRARPVTALGYPATILPLTRTIPLRDPPHPRG